MCWKCGAVTPVYAIALDAGHETLDEWESEDEYAPTMTETWDRQDETTILHFVAALDPAAASILRQHAPDYRMDHSGTTQGRYWMNHCSHCGSKIGDFYLHNEPEGAFFPIDPRQASMIRLKPIIEPIKAQSSYSMGGVDFFENMRKISE